MNGRAYYNEYDSKKAEWLRELIRAGAIAPGHVDSRSIRDVQPGDLAGFVQCHFFAGIGVWSHALRLAGWPDDRPVWTGSCPCQPFSAAGKRKGQADDRHLWPDLFRLIRERRPVAFYGEQVASPDGLAWLDTVFADMEGADYTIGANDLCAAGFGAPHIRQRLCIVGKSNDARCKQGIIASETARHGNTVDPASGAGVGLADTARQFIDRRGRERHGSAEPANGGVMVHTPRRGFGEFGHAAQPRRSGHADGAEKLVGVTLGDTERAGLEGHVRHGHNSGGWQEQARPIAPAGVTNGYWRGAELIPCSDGKWRPIEPGSEPLADGPAAGLVRVRDARGLSIEAEARETFPLIRKARARTMRLRGYGDAIVAPQLAAFIEATGVRG